MARILDLSGKRFGRLVVISELPERTQKQQVQWECLCDCGNSKTVISPYLVNGDTKSCGCYKRDMAKEKAKKLHIAQTKESGVAARNALYSEYKHSARYRNYVFDLTLEEFSYLTQQPCFYCSIAPNQIMHRHGYNGDYIYNGIDRVDNTQGYILNNCVACCGMCNTAKNNQTQQEFENWIERAYNTLQQRRKIQ